MPNTELFQEKVLRVERPSKHFTLLRAPNGDFLGVSDETLSTFDHADDKVIWEKVDGSPNYRHVASGMLLEEESAEAGSYLSHEGTRLGGDGSATDKGALFTPGHGPAHLPSEYLQAIRQNGWVCLPAILDPATVEDLERHSCTGRWDNNTYERSKPPLNETAAVARAATEPVSLWLIRQYMQMDEIRLAHSPSFAIVPPDDGERNVQGWHSDYPYLWGIAHNAGGNRIPTHNAIELVLGIQRNLCISEFSKENGATCFKLGTHTLGEGPPLEWGNGTTHREQGYRKANGLPYNGPEAEVIEAPAGSYVIYDSRTWHRAGVNHSEHKRAAMLQAVVPMYIMPFMDTSHPYKEFVNSPLVNQLTEREQLELESIMVSRIDGPSGRFAITVDDEMAAQPGYRRE